MPVRRIPQGIFKRSVSCCRHLVQFLNRGCFWTFERSGNDLIMPRDLQGNNDQVHTSVAEKVVMVVVCGGNPECFSRPEGIGPKADAQSAHR
jgi:hypothetical protein